MKGCRILSGLMLLLLNACLTVPATGQTYASQRGHVLDANNRVGSLGWNTTQRLDPLSRRVELGVTGNLRYGANFRGLIPYTSIHEFGSSLGSSSLSDFSRDSVGVADLDNRTFGVGQFTPYVDPSRQLTRSVDGQVVSTSRLYQNQVRSSESVASTPDNRPLSLQSPLNRSVGSPDFRLSLPDADWDRRFDFQADSKDPAYPNLALPRNPIDIEMPAQLLLEDQTQTQEQDNSEPTEAVATEQLPVSFYQRISEQLEVAAELDLTGQAEGIDSEPKGPARSDIRSNAVRRAPSAQDDAMTRALALQNEAAGRGYVHEGERLLREGAFYRAAGAFDLAAIYRPDDAALDLARCHAYFGSGDFLSSAHFLGRALMRDARLAAAKVDFRELLTNQEQLQLRLDDLNNWISRTNDENLRFIKSYVQLQLGSKDESRKLLKRLREDRTDNPAVDAMWAALDDDADE